MCGERASALPVTAFVARGRARLHQGIALSTELPEMTHVLGDATASNSAKTLGPLPTPSVRKQKTSETYNSGSEPPTHCLVNLSEFCQ
jgi:hypothetical protein